MHLGAGIGERHGCAPQRELHWVLHLEGLSLLFKVKVSGEVPGEDLNAVFTSFSGVSPQGGSFH